MIFIVKVIKIIVYLYNTQWCFSLGLIPLATYLILCSVVFLIHKVFDSAGP